MDEPTVIRISIEGITEEFRRQSQIAILTLGYDSMKAFIIEKLQEAQALAARQPQAAKPAKSGSK